jgi:tRNA (cytidine/uridine-2'-O-)-methyltransferase
MHSPPERHIVLVAPEVHWNTGNIGRTCLGANAALHLIEPLGFSLESRELKRAGLDYWHKIDLKVWKNFSAFLEGARPEAGEIALFTRKGGASFRELPPARRLFLVFGSETKGLPDSILARYPRDTYFIPITAQIRCLNLSTAVGIVLYESLRQAPLPFGCSAGG